MVVLALSPLILGAGHLASWNLQFQLNNAQIMWRAASIATIVLLVGFAIAAIKCNFHKHKTQWVWLMFAAGAAYLIARFLLLYLLVYSFWSLPEDVYATEDVNWLNYIPFLH